MNKTVDFLENARMEEARLAQLAAEEEERKKKKRLRKKNKADKLRRGGTRSPNKKPKMETVVDKIVDVMQMEKEMEKVVIEDDGTIEKVEELQKSKKLIYSSKRKVRNNFSKRR